MPSTLNAPGIYIEEVPSGVRPVVGVSTSDTAFVDWFPRGPVGDPTRVTSFDEFTRVFGGLHKQSLASYAIFQYFQKGGAVAWVVRANIAAGNTATRPLTGGSPAQTVATVNARNPGRWGGNLRVAVTSVPGDATRFNLFVREMADDGRVVDSEVHRNLSTDTTAADYMVSVVEGASRLVRVVDDGPGGLPTLVAPTATGGAPEDAYQALTVADDTAVLGAAGTAVDAPGFQTALVTAMRSLASIDPFVFNILCIPAMAALGDQQDDLVTAAETFCEGERAFLLVDPPATVTGSTAMQTWLAGVNGLPSKNAAVYFPRLLMSDPLDRGRPRNIAPSGAVAGVYARTDATRGVWKAPAGIDATLGGVDLVPPVLSDADSAALNPLGINALRRLPVVGNVVWGARTLFGADQRASEWKYIPVRRTALFIEQSLEGGLKWVVFEPNDEPLWAQIRLNVGSFMQDLFRKGAFQGSTPREAYFVRCDKNTTTQSDIDKGIVNILVGFAPLKPAEFVVIQIQQMAGQATA